MLEEISREFSEYIKSKHYRFSFLRKWIFQMNEEKTECMFGFDGAFEPRFFISTFGDETSLRFFCQGVSDKKRKELSYLTTYFPQFLKERGYDKLILSQPLALFSTGEKSDRLKESFLYLQKHLNMFFIEEGFISFFLESFGQDGSMANIVFEKESINIYLTSPSRFLLGQVKNIDEAKSFILFLKTEREKMERAEKEVLKEFDKLKIPYNHYATAQIVEVFNSEIPVEVKSKGFVYTLFFDRYVINDRDFDSLVEKGKTTVKEYGVTNRLRAITNVR